MANNSGPFRLLNTAIKAVPAVKFALGVAGIMAALALAKGFFLSTAEALIGAAFMLVLMFLLVVFAAAARTQSAALRPMALVATWAILLLFVLSACFLVTSVFFAWPLPLSGLVDSLHIKPGNDGNQPKPTVFDHDPNVTPDRLPPPLVTPVAETGNVRALSMALSRKGSLVLDASTFTVAPIGAKVSLTIAVDTLTLAHGARIVTNGNNLTIQAARIIGGGSILAFRPEDRTPPLTSTKYNGFNGQGGGMVSLDAAQIDGNLTLDLTAQNGGVGGDGGPGPAGQGGSRGANAVEGLFDCRSGGQDGGQGGQGGKGQPGGDGGDGGSGGDLYLSKSLQAQKSRIHYILDGGAPGGHGQGGPGGPGGPGGEGGSGSAKCGGGHGGSQGPPGLPGDNGHEGSPGKPGQVHP